MVVNAGIVEKEEKGVLNDREGVEVEVQEKKVLAVWQTPLFYTRARAHYQQNLQGRRLNYTNVVEQFIQPW